MGKGVPLPLRNRLAVIFSIVAAACARSAPDLPPDYGSINATQEISLDAFSEQDANASCTEINAEQERVQVEFAAIENAITSTRQDDQTAGYLAAILLPPAGLAIEQKTERKEQLDHMQARLDELNALSRVKNCP